MTYPECVRFLYSLGNEVAAAKLGLERMTVLLAALGDPHRRGRFVHVAGTNGKGSTCAMIESALRASGLHTGLYTSPHLSEPTERIRIDGRPVAAETFAAAFDRVHGAAEALLRDGVFEAHPTYFETVTAMAFVIFEQAGVDFATLEVGLGGRLDATNVVQPELCVVTPVDYDHEAFLGRGLEAITREKAGILKKGAPAVFSDQRPEAAATLAACAEAAGVDVTWASKWRREDVSLGPWGSSFVAAGPRTLKVDCPLAGEHQVVNAATAVAALDRLGLSSEAIVEGIKRTRWPGRLERVATTPDIVLDGAHNPAGARALAAYIRRFHAGRRVWLIYGAMRDKAVSEMAGILFPAADEVILTAPPLKRAVRPEVIRDLVEHDRVRVAPDLPAALAMAAEAGPDDIVFVSGSLFLVGEARGALVK